MIAVFGQGAWAAQLGSLAIVGAFTVVTTVILVKLAGALVGFRRCRDRSQRAGPDARRRTGV